jgi:predicted peroxiredoxin
MAGKAVISLSTGLEDPEKVTVAFLVAVGAAESGRPTLMFQAKEAVRLALDGTAAGTACDGCPALPDLLARYEKAGGRFMVCPVCFNAKQLDKGTLLSNAELAGSVQLWEWIGDEGATTFSAGPHAQHQEAGGAPGTMARQTRHDRCRRPKSSARIPGASIQPWAGIR